MTRITTINGTFVVTESPEQVTSALVNAYLGDTQTFSLCKFKNHEGGELVWINSAYVVAVEMEEL